jgi:hypothetical protein
MGPDTLGTDRDAMKRRRQPTFLRSEPAQAEREPTASAQDTAMNETSSLPPANGSTPEPISHNDSINVGEPSLACSGDQHASCSPRLQGVPTFHGHSDSQGEGSNPAPLEERLRRLEDALAQVPDAGQIESRIVERVSQRLGSERPIPVAQIAPAPAVAPQTPNLTIPAGMILDVGKRILNSSGNAMTRPPAMQEHPDAAMMNGVRRTYMFFEMLTEMRAIWCMYTDPRYRMSWGGRMVPLALALFLLTSSFLVPGAQISIVGTFIDKLVCAIPAFVLFKLLTYEARRYRETAPDLPADLRL